MHKNNGATKMFLETPIPKLPKKLSNVEIFNKIKFKYTQNFTEHEINLLQILSLTLKTLGTAQNTFFCCLVMFKFQSYSKHNLGLWNFPPWNLLRIWFPLANSQPEYSHLVVFPSRKTPTRKIPTQDNYHAENSHSDYSNPKSSV